MEKTKEILIHIRSTQTDSLGEKSEMEFYTAGKFGIIGEAKYLIYEESEISGLQGTRSTIKISGGEVSLIRFGSSNSKFQFIVGETTHTIYSTEYGNFDMEVFTHAAELEIKEDGDGSPSHIYLRYTLKIAHLGEFLNELQLTY